MKGFRTLSVVLAAAAMALLVRTGWSGWKELRDSDTSIRFGWLALSVLFAGAAMTWIAFTWRNVMRVCGCELPTSTTIGTYYLGEIGKYVPGAIWPVVGRGEIARRQRIALGHETPRGQIYESVILSLMYLFLAGLFVSVVGVVGSGFAGGWSLMLLLIAPLGVGALHPPIAHWGLGLLRRLTKGRFTPPVVPAFFISIRMILLYTPAWVFVVASAWASGRAIGLDLGLYALIAATCLGWVAGFVFIPAPGGLGPREWVFTAMLGSQIRPGQAALFAVASRASFIVVDAFGALVGSWVLRRTSSRMRSPTSSRRRR